MISRSKVARARARVPNPVRRVRNSGLTRLRPIMTVIGRNPGRQTPAPRRFGGGANGCEYGVFRFPAPAQARDGRPARPTGRPGAEHGGRCDAPERNTPRTAVRARRCHRGRSRVPEPAAGIRRRRTAEPGAAFRFSAAWTSCAHLPAIPCLRRGASQGDALHQSGGNAAARGQLHFSMPSMPSIGDAHRPAPRRSRPGACVPPFPLLLVTGPGPAWIMPVAGTFMRRRHATKPESMAPPRIARPQPRGQSGRICAAFPRIGRRRMPSAPPAAHARPRRRSRTRSQCRSRHTRKLNSAGQESHRPLRDDPHRAHRWDSRARGENRHCTPFPSPTAGRALVPKVRHALIL